MRSAKPSLRKRRSGMVRAVFGIWPNWSEAPRTAQEAKRCGRRNWLMPRKVKMSLLYQASDSMVERRVQERLAWWEILLGHLDEALRGALRKSSEREEASVATAADWWHLRRGSVHGDSCVNVMRSEHLANLAEILNVQKVTAVYVK